LPVALLLVVSVPLKLIARGDPDGLALKVQLAPPFFFTFAVKGPYVRFRSDPAEHGSRMENLNFVTDSFENFAANVTFLP
jgi:hypothetical protein